MEILVFFQRTTPAPFLLADDWGIWHSGNSSTWDNWVYDKLPTNGNVWGNFGQTGFIFCNVKQRTLVSASYQYYVPYGRAVTFTENDGHYSVTLGSEFSIPLTGYNISAIDYLFIYGSNASAGVGVTFS